jgi:predicted aspartyl protease
MKHIASILLACLCSAALTCEALLWSNLRRTIIKSNAPFHRGSLLSNASDLDAEIESVRSMRIKDLKLELDTSLIDYSDVLEKEELVRRVVQARKHDTLRAAAVKSKNGYATPNRAIVVPLFVITPSSRKLTLTDEISMAIDTGDEFPAIQIKIPLAPGSKNEHTLTLLVDTACSSLVLRPTIPRQLGLPLLSSPASTMTGASGVGAGAGHITQLPRFYLDGHQCRHEFGPLPAALQDIGVLPSVLDGIIGMTFLSRFEAVDFDFESSRLIFHIEPPGQNINHGSTAPMQMIGSYGIYAVDAWLDGRGPIRLLIDTGASSTFINPQGVKDLGFQMVDLEPINSMGAVGSDNVAMSMTHRFFINKSICLGDGGRGRIKLMDPFEVCVAEIPILASMPNVGGILGIDALRQCQYLRVSWKYPPTVTVFQL